MKLNYISSSTIPSKTANSVHVMKMAQALSDQGFDVSLYARGNSSNEQDKDFEYYGVKKVFKIRKFKVPGIRFVNGFYYTYSVLRNIKKECKSNRDSIFYGRDLLTLVFLSLRYNNIYYEAHELPSSFIRKLLVRILFKSKNFKGLTVISSALESMFKEKYNNIIDINVLHDGADVNKIEITDAKKDEIIIGYIGSIYKGRGIENIIEIANRLPNIKFQIVGGTREQVIQLFSQEVNLPTNLELIGYVNPGEVPKYLSKMTIVLAPYQKKVGIANKGKDTSKWMSPLKIFEYMAAQKPIICSDITVLREVLRDNYNCLLVNPEIIDEWVQAIRELIEDDELRNRIAQQARNDLENIFSWEVRAKNLKQIINCNNND